ncbi:cell division protein FtsL [Acidocella aromatica]|uniref:Uncharacterized protein n=1 Tax=Acidocella aromatica TaxID=1303579 RepID=A0A840V879_9PROT|nr:hypothetical protein [Acidocella aromatica]MBB5371923.1 hypothetical protein [Acidocella aromatica]
MIVRPLTLISGMMFAFSGAYLFMVKHHSEALDDQISQVTQQTRQDEQSIRVLQAQWALEADPSRLASLAAQFTGLQPMKPGQLTTLASLGSALPSPGSPPPGANPADPVPAMPQLAQAAPATALASTPAAAPAAVASAAKPAAPSLATKPAAQVQLASVNAAAVAAAAPKPAVAKHAEAQPERLASADSVTHHTAHHSVHATHEENGSALYVASASPAPRAQPIGAQVMSVRAVASAAPAPMPIDNGGSMLGMAQGGDN